MKNNNQRENRIKIVNDIIKEISSCGRKFFNHEGSVAEIYERKNRLYMVNEYNGEHMCLNTKFGYPPKHWHHGGTMWALTKDFKEFIQYGGKTNHNNGYGGLYCPHWGYDEESMKNIQNKAKELNYL
jgi:hypothetical protein